MSRRRAGLVVLVLLGAVAAQTPAAAGLSREQRQELARLRQDLARATVLTRQKKLDEAEAIVGEAERRLAAILQRSPEAADDRAVAAVKKSIAARRAALSSAAGSEKKPAQPMPKAGVSFVRDVAPVFATHCVGCHSENPQAKLRLDTFAGMEQGGRSGPLLVVGQARNSLLMARLLAAPPHRMPKDAQPLTRQQLETIAAWINQGAVFDGNDKTVPLSKLTVTAEAGSDAPTRPPVAVARPTGGETVSFRRDIAPFLVNLCVGCHGGNEPKSEFSLETFEKLMQGGKSGAVIVPGDLDGSRLWALVGKQDPIKMPMGEARITRANHEHLRKWIVEGAKFDGDDPAAPLRSLVPDAEERRLKELASLGPAEFAALRRRRAQEHWDKALPKTTPAKLESDEFVVYGDVPEARLAQVAAWAVEHSGVLRNWLGEPATSGPLFRGGLGIYVLRDRFGFNEFHIELQGREAPPARSHFAVVSAGQEDALVVVQDVGDEARAAAPALKQALLMAMVDAALMRSSGKVPGWLATGTAFALSAESDARNAYNEQVHAQGRHAVDLLAKPEDIYTGRGLPPELIEPAECAFVAFIIHRGGRERFQKFLKMVVGGAEVEKASAEIYGTNLAGIAQQFAASRRK